MFLCLKGFRRLTFPATFRPSLRADWEATFVGIISGVGP